MKTVDLIGAGGMGEVYRAQDLELGLAGVSAIEPVIIAPDGKSCAYGLNRRLSDLFVVEGLN